MIKHLKNNRSGLHPNNNENSHIHAYPIAVTIIWGSWQTKPSEGDGAAFTNKPENSTPGNCPQQRELEHLQSP